MNMKMKRHKVEPIFSMDNKKANWIDDGSESGSESLYSNDWMCIENNPVGQSAHKFKSMPLLQEANKKSQS